MVELLETAKRELERDREAAKASLATASIILQSETARCCRKARAELAHASRVTTLGQLAAWIAHEVKQPIAASVNNAGAFTAFAVLLFLAIASLTLDHGPAVAFGALVSPMFVLPPLMVVLVAWIAAAGVTKSAARLNL